MKWIYNISKLWLFGEKAMDEYQKPYLHLFNAVTDAIERLRCGACSEAILLLMKAQQEAEELFISGRE